MIRAAHVAVIADLTINGTVPEGFNMYQHGVGKVKKYFAAANLLFVLDRLVSAAVKQIQRALNKVANFLKFIPGVKNIMGIINLFVDIILNYVDECIMAYIFLHEGQSAWKSAADGVVLYVQNWKTVLKTGAKILVFLVLFFVVSFLAFNGLFVSVLSGIIGLDSLVSPFATILTIVFILVLKWAVVDSIVMIYMMNNYLKVAYGTEPSYDLYEKLKGMSKKFRELVGKTNQPSGEGIGATI
ncbi:MAG: hypothetical protein GX957_07740 [Clostridiaceae bacterium]|nr:hypothetical protein [Clostridiaceae bacterium]